MPDWEVYFFLSKRGENVIKAWLEDESVQAKQIAASTHVLSRSLWGQGVHGVDRGHRKGQRAYSVGRKGKGPKQFDHA